MFKKMLKGILAIATVCAMSAAANAETVINGYVASSFGMYTSGVGATSVTDVPHYGEFKFTSTGESYKGYMKIAETDGTITLKSASVDWYVSDSLTVGMGTASDVVSPMLGKSSLRQVDFGVGRVGVGTLADAAPSLYTTSTMLQFTIGLGDAGKAYAGIIEGTDMAFYGIYAASAGDLSYIVGMKTQPGSDAVMGGGLGYAMGSMDVTFDYFMAGSKNQMKVGFNMAQIGPGDLRTYLNTYTGVTSYNMMGATYTYAIDPAAKLQAMYLSDSQSRSWMGVSLSANF